MIDRAGSSAEPGTAANGLRDEPFRLGNRSGKVVAQGEKRGDGGGEGTTCSMRVARVDSRPPKFEPFVLVEEHVGGVSGEVTALYEDRARTHGR
jgi:hypothetical protein